MPRFPVVAVVLAAIALSACRKPDESPLPATPAATVPVPAVDAARPAAPKPATGKQTPALRVATIDGKRFDLAAHRGQWVVVNFWATWCAPCLKEMPELSALDAMREHIKVIGLAYEEIDAAAMRDFLKVHPVVYPIAIIDTYNPPVDFDTPRGLPMTYLIAPDGTVAKKILGPVTAQGIEAAIDAAGGKRNGTTDAAGGKRNGTTDAAGGKRNGTSDAAGGTRHGTPAAGVGKRHGTPAAAVGLLAADAPPKPGRS